MNITYLVGKVLTPREGLPRSLVTITQGRIKSIQPWPSFEAPPGAIDAEDGWIAPGFIDLQVNGAYGQDFSDPHSNIGLVASRLPAHGVTGFLPTLISLPLERYLDCLPRFEGAVEHGARVLGVHLEGPFISPSYHGAHQPEHLCLPDRTWIERLLSCGPVRLVTLAPGLPGGLAAIRLLRERGVVVALGHSGASYRNSLEAIQAGASMATHLFNAMAPFHHREPGLAGAALCHADVVASIIPDGVHLHPATIQLAFRAKGPGHLCLVTDSTPAAGLSTGKYTLAGQTITADQAARLADGTLAGSLLTMDRAVQNMVQMALCSPREAIEMATLSPARVIGLDSHKGMVTPGYDADLVVLGPDLSVRATLVAGEVLYRAPVDGAPK